MSDAILAEDLRGTGRPGHAPGALATPGQSQGQARQRQLDTPRRPAPLRHLCYHAEGYIDPRSNEEFSDTHDFAGRSRTIVVYEGAEPIGSVRVCTARRSLGEALPLADTFPDEFATAFAPYELAVEINRLVCHPEYSQNQAVVFVLIRMASYRHSSVNSGQTVSLDHYIHPQQGLGNDSATSAEET